MRLAESVGCTQRKFGVSCPKVFAGFKRGLFSKSPLFARLRRAIESVCSPRNVCMAFSLCRQGVLPLVHFLLREHPVNQSPSFVGATFSPRRHIAPLVYCIYLWSRYLPEAKNMLPHGASRFFASRKTEWFWFTGCSLKRKRRTKESDRTIDRVTLMSGRGAYGMPLTGFGANIRCVHSTDSESCTAGADQWSPLQKLGCAYPKQRASLSAPPQVDFGDRKRKKSKETRLYSRVSFLDFVKVAQSQEVSQTFRKPTPPKTYISACGLHKFCKPQGKFIKISQKPR